LGAHDNDPGREGIDVNEPNGSDVSLAEIFPCPQLNLGHAGLLGMNVLSRREPMTLLDERLTLKASAAAWHEPPASAALDSRHIRVERGAG
jgi:hypothetical protein